MSCAALLSVALLAATPEAPEVFALVVGVNSSVDPDLETLLYADDDASRYFELFSSLGAEVSLLSRLDEGTARLHVAAKNAAQLPRLLEWQHAVSNLLLRVERSKHTGHTPVVYVVYAGHGNVRAGEGYLTLEDARLTATELTRELFGKLQGLTVHLIVDACQSSFLAVGRGPGGERRAAANYTVAAIPEYVGLLLSTGSFRESHEWEGFQAGVFSHEVRSGLFGAADVDGDGLVSYREIAAFIEQANRSIMNEKYRPDVYARAPSGSASLLDLRLRSARRLSIDAAHASRYSMEDERGVRFADFHHAQGQAVSLVLPTFGGTIFVRALDQKNEYALPPAGSIVLSQLTPSHAQVLSRGAANVAFSRIFVTPFSHADAERYAFSTLEVTQGLSTARRALGIGTLVASGGALIAGVVCTLQGNALRTNAPPDESQLLRAARNADLNRLFIGSVASFIASGVFAALGVGTLAWPSDLWVGLTVSSNGMALSFSGPW